MSFIRIANMFERFFYENCIRKQPVVTLSFDDRDTYMRAEAALLHELWNLDPRGKIPSIVGGVTISGVHIVLELKEPAKAPDWRSTCATGKELG